MVQKIFSHTKIVTYSEDISHIYEKKFNKSSSVSAEDVRNSLSEIFSQEYFKKILKNFKGKHVVLKPNMAGIYPKDVKGLTTSMEVVEGVLVYLKNCQKSLRYDSIKIVESTSINLPNSSDYMFQVTGLSDLAEKHRVRLVDVKKDFYIKFKKKFQYIDELLFSKEVSAADILINIPVMKGYPFTMCCKNLMGLLADPYKPKMHTDLKNKIPELARILRPTLNIVDGIYGAENHAGDKISKLRSRKFNTLLVSLDPLAADLYASKLWGYKDAKISTLNIDYSHNIGLGNTNYKVIRV